MGWSSGGDIAEVLERVIVRHVPREKWYQAAKPVLEALEDQDWDDRNWQDMDIWSWVDIKSGNMKEEDYEEEELEEFKEWKKKLNKKYGKQKA